MKRAGNITVEILYVKDDNGRILSIKYLIWDEQSIYYLLGGSMPYFRIRKVFNPEIVRAEAEKQIQLLKESEEEHLSDNHM